MLNFKKFLNEKFENTYLFHCVAIDTHLINILDDMYLAFSPIISGYDEERDKTESEFAELEFGNNWQRKVSHYLSTSRNSNNKYSLEAIDISADSWIIGQFRLNAKKLSDNFIIRPVNFFNDPMDIRTGRYRSESEERIYALSKNNVLPILDLYLYALELSILFPPRYFFNSDDDLENEYNVLGDNPNWDIKPLLEIVQQKNITDKELPIYFFKYEQKNNFLNHNIEQGYLFNAF